MRTRSEWECGNHCFKAAVRTVWDGSQVLYEISAPGYTGAGAARMEQDTGIVVKEDTSMYFPWGRVAYTYGQKLDQPLSLIRMEYSDSFYAPVAILPNANWRGVFDFSASSLPCVQEWQHTTITDSSLVPVCMQMDWPAPYMWMTQYERPRGVLGPVSWMGNVIESGRDASGQMYMRNRYYDPRSGRFTQEDPLGLAGGLNLYGFANGDPVNFSDPFGLCPVPPDNCPFGYTIFGALSGLAAGTGAGLAAAAPTAELASPLTVPTGAAIGAATGALGGLAVDASNAFMKSSLGKEIHRKVTKAIETIGLIIGLLTGEPPKKPDPEKDKPPPPAPTSTKTVLTCDQDRDRCQ